MSESERASECVVVCGVSVCFLSAGMCVFVCGLFAAHSQRTCASGSCGVSCSMVFYGGKLALSLMNEVVAMLVKTHHGFEGLSLCGRREKRSLMREGGSL